MQEINFLTKNRVSEFIRGCLHIVHVKSSSVLMLIFIHILAVAKIFEKNSAHM